MMMSDVSLTELTAVIVASFVSNNPLATAEIPQLIASTHAALARLESAVAHAGRGPAVPIEESVGWDYLVCLEDGRRLRTLKRYLRRRHSMSPEQYRSKWALPEDYPMVAPGYAELRSKIAKRRMSRISGG
ncbi:Ros/MucR family transcriptional regulator [Paraburkholderia sp. 2C]|jgi:MucR family transcriptional regulator, transcriptional regulator of exopolysaccharide biosynthesis